MHSLKNTVVAVLLLGVSWGVYNVITTPTPDEDYGELVGPVTIDDGLSSNLPGTPPPGTPLELPSVGQVAGSLQNLGGDLQNLAVEAGDRAVQQIDSAREQIQSTASEFGGSIGGQINEFSRAVSENVQPVAPPVSGTVPGLAPPVATRPPGGSFAGSVNNVPALPVSSGGSFTPGGSQNKPDGYYSGQLIPGEVSQTNPQFDLVPGNSRNAPASAEVPADDPAGFEMVDSTPGTPEDQVLIDALRNQLETDNDIFVSEPNNNSFLPPAASTPPVYGSGSGTSASDSNGGVTASAPPVTPTEYGSFDVSPPARVAAAPASPPATSSSQPVSTGPLPLSGVWPGVEKMVADGNYRGALGTLSRFYADPSLSEMESENLIIWLDSLAGKAIYSPEHNLFQKSYVVQPGETISDLARRWEVTSQLIYNVNRPNIPDPADLVPGTEIKMIAGPFHAEVNTQTGMMTLFVKNLYAGRFQIQLPANTPLNSGWFAVSDKSRENLMDDSWTITLENGLVIKTVQPGAPVPHGCVGLFPEDAADVFGILTGNSRVFVK